jgi:hypothetical protein
VRAGDALEVHGLWSREGGQWLMLASRIEKLISLPDTVLLTAPVRSRSADRLWLDDAQGTELRAAELPASVQAGSLGEQAVVEGTRAATRLLQLALLLLLLVCRMPRTFAVQHCGLKSALLTWSTLSRAHRPSSNIRRSC